MSHGSVRAAYGPRATEYTALFGTIESTHPADQTLIAAWARGLGGKVIDAGCGPGQWTNFLHALRVDAEGVDIVPEFIESARQHYPNTAFRVGSLEQLQVPDQSLAGILAWYSLIHTSPDDIPTVLAEFARCLAPGGSLLMGFFEGETVEEFPHAVMPAYFWPVAEMGKCLDRAGFLVTSSNSRKDPDARPHASIIPTRTPGPALVP
ncbi:class I SAM-dependent methyltransferase [Paenarthrobacter sp. UW852]|uniref:class I SAM-dependent methyltransferase n=1 Tax=Paenarthrobacter sp. UW852 TaxID=2951989 RepID=UPI002147835F|nr:class I SAM-dependent methyltransferase [Paenarthrobacter sp. UW852]MCR1162353.1 class I SAM-dependent methyltransferase [Paenarthrobacter sp. UW852]